MSKIKFIEQSHQYLTTEGDQELVSVSKFTDSFKEKQDWDKIAQRVATKQTKAGIPTTKADVMAKWDNKRDKAAAVGTLFHAIRENALIEENAPVFYGKECTKAICHTTPTAKYSIPINELQNNTVYPELMIYDEEHMLCGQADKIIVLDNKIHVWDYKTDAEIKFKGYSSEWKSATKLKAPLSHLEECNGVVYSIKMSLYMYMLWKANKGRFLPGDLIIEHVTLKRDPLNDNIPILDENGKPVVLKIEQIKLPYRKKEVEAMLKTLKTK